MEPATGRINVKVRSATADEAGERRYHVICEYFPKHAGRAARVSRFVRAGEGFDLQIPPPQTGALQQGDEEFLEELRENPASQGKGWRQTANANHGRKRVHDSQDLLRLPEGKSRRPGHKARARGDEEAPHPPHRAQDHPQAAVLKAVRNGPTEPKLPFQKPAAYQ